MPVLPIGVSRHFWAAACFQSVTSPNKLQFRMQINQKMDWTKQKENTLESIIKPDFRGFSWKGDMLIRQTVAMKGLLLLSQDMECSIHLVHAGKPIMHCVIFFSVG